MRDASIGVIIKALRVLARDIQSDDGVANLALLEAANCMEKIERERDEAREALKHIDEYGTEEINAAVELRQKLAQALVERDEAREECDKLKQLLLAADSDVDAYLGLMLQRDEARDKVWRLEKQIEGLNNAANERFK